MRPHFATENIRLLVAFFFFIFKSIPIFVLAFIVQTAVATTLTPKVESLAVICFRAFAASILSATYFFCKIFVMRIDYIMFAITD